MKKEMFGTVAGGYARVLQRFGERLRADGVTLRLSAPVTRVERVGAQLRVTAGGGAPEDFDHVVVTAAAPVAARLCQGLSAAEARQLADVRYLGIVCPSVLLKRPLDGYYVTNLLDEGLPFTGVIEMSAMARPHHFGGRGLVYLPRYAAADDPVFGLTDEQLRAQHVAGLQRVYPQVRDEDVLAFQVSRVRHVMPLPTLGYSTRLPPVDTSVPGLHLVNSAHIVNGTLNVNETVMLAERAAKNFAALA
jgi:protoporphyrinogen oxidase